MLLKNLWRVWETRKNHLEFYQNVTWKTWKKPGISYQIHAENPGGGVQFLVKTSNPC